MFRAGGVKTNIGRLWFLYVLMQASPVLPVYCQTENTRRQYYLLVEQEASREKNERFENTHLYKGAEMIKYVITATELKLFSTTPQTKRIYRLLGNTLGQRRRIQHGLDESYMERAKRILYLCEKHHAVHSGDKLLEIGTGWLHWESTIIRLFYDVEITLFDVWDNRQFGAYQQFFRQLEQIIDKKIDMTPAQHDRVHGLLQAISKASSFDEVYNLLGFHYVIDPDGTLKQLQDESYALIFSCNVLEHVDRKILPEYVQDFSRILKPGGFSIQEIDLGDHLYHYDTSVPLKNYLRYSNATWRRFFENDVQYFNRVQRPEWLHLYCTAGLETVEEESIPSDISSLKIDTSYRQLGRQDLECLTLRVVHRKPGYQQE